MLSVYLGVRPSSILRQSKVYTRIAECEGSIYLDLCNRIGKLVQIKPDGWEVTQNPPVYFKRSSSMKPLPHPESGGNISELFNFINAGDEDTKALIAAFLVGALKPKGPYPILIITGEQGSAKSTTAKLIRALIDPSVSPLRTLPRSERDLMLSAMNNWLLVFDNLSGFPPWISDSLCRMSTGGGLSTRGLYTDSDEVIFNAMRPAILNGIDEFANRDDLIDRSLIIKLPRIPKGKRRLDKTIWREFEKAKPKILGALLDAVSTAMRNFDKVNLKTLPRMADFAQWIVAAETAMPFKPGEFIEIYQRNLEESEQSIFESNPVAMALLELVRDKRKLVGYGHRSFR